MGVRQRIRRYEDFDPENEKEDGYQTDREDFQPLHEHVRVRLRKMHSWNVFHSTVPPFDSQALFRHAPKKSGPTTLPPYPVARRLRDERDRDGRSVCLGRPGHESYRFPFLCRQPRYSLMEKRQAQNHSSGWLSGGQPTHSQVMRLSMVSAKVRYSTRPADLQG